MTKEPRERQAQILRDRPATKLGQKKLCVGLTLEAGSRVQSNARRLSRAERLGKGHGLAGAQRVTSDQRASLCALWLVSSVEEVFTREAEGETRGGSQETVDQF